MAIRALSGLVLPNRPEFKRDIVSRDELRVGAFNAEYDFNTLVYDAFYVPERGATALICPPLLNLKHVFRGADWREGPTKLRLAAMLEHKRWVEVWMRGARLGRDIAFEYDDFDARITPSHCEPELFSGLCCALTKSRNNDLRWLWDWADYHARVHGLEGVVLFDHMSDRYTAADVEATLSSVPGIRSVCVIESAYPFGPTNDNNALFLQVAEMNIARLRFLPRAAGVLCVDIDELVAPSPDGSVFATARKSPLGYALFRGSWRYPQPAAKSRPRLHRDHVLRREGERDCQTKYCIRPKGLFGNVHWDIHGSVRGFLKPRLVTTKLHYWHCWGISTSWKNDRGEARGEGLVVDEPLAHFLNSAFPEGAGALQEVCEGPAGALPPK